MTDPVIAKDEMSAKKTDAATVPEDASERRIVVQIHTLPKYRVPVYRELNRRPGWSLKVVYTDPAIGPSNVPADGFEGEPEPRRGLQIGRRWVRWHSACWREAAKGRADVLILSWDVQNLSLLPGLLRARWNNIPTVLWGHGYSKHEAGWRQAIRRWFGRRGDTLLFYNHATRQDHIDAGFDPDRLFVAINSLDQAPVREAAQYWRDRPDELAAFAKQHDLAGKKVLLYVSRIDPANRLDWLIQAAGRLRQQGHDVVVVVIGDVDGEAPEGKAIAKQAEANAGLEGHVRWVGKLYGETQLAPWFLCSHAFVYPANIGLSLLHAFGYGLPVVTSNDIASHNPEIEALQDGVNGRLYQDADPDDLARVLAEILEDEPARARMSEAALRTVTEDFTLHRMVDGMEAALRKAIARHNPKR